MSGIEQFCSAPGVYGLLISEACQSCSPIRMKRESSKHQTVCCSAQTVSLTMLLLLRPVFTAATVSVI